MALWKKREVEAPESMSSYWDSPQGGPLFDAVTQSFPQVAASFRRSGNRQELLRVAQRMAHVYETAFPGYQVYWNVALEDIVENAPSSLKPVHFLFVRNEEPVLAVVVTTPFALKCSSVEGSRAWLQAARVEYLRFLIGDAYYTNTGEYIYQRTRDALERIGA